jgi:hypothetical protein
LQFVRCLNIGLVEAWKEPVAIVWLKIGVQIFLEEMIKSFAGKKKVEYLVVFRIDELVKTCSIMVIFVGINYFDDVLLLKMSIYDNADDFIITPSKGANQCLNDAISK